MSQRPLVFIIIPIPTGLSRGASAGKTDCRASLYPKTPRALASRRGLARNDKVRRAGPACPAGSNAYFAAGHMDPALRDLRLTHPAIVRKADTKCE